MREYNLENKDLYYIAYDITMACNNRCSYCYCLDELDNKKLFNEDVFNKTIQAIKEFKTDEERLLIAFTGGEPILVLEKVIEFYNELEYIAEFMLFSNLNFEPNSDKINKLYNFIQSSKVKLVASFHASSNIDNFKQNVLKFKDKCIVTLLIDSININEQYENFKWLRENNIAYEIIKVIRNDGLDFDFKNEKFIEMATCKLSVTYGKIESSDFGRTYEDIKYMALRFMTICQISSLQIKYDGSIKSICGYPVNSHIDTGIPKLGMKFCKYECSCNLTNYRKIGQPYKHFKAHQ